MPITAITVSDITDFAGGHEFGTVGAYLRIRSVARGVLDPDAAENAGIVDLDKAPRNAAGLVEYATDVDMLRPKNMRRGSSILVYDVPNRGSKRIFTLLDDVAPIIRAAETGANHRHLQDRVLLHLQHRGLQPALERYQHAITGPP